LLCWSIVSKEVDDKIKLQALALANDCNKYKTDLTTNGVVLTDAIKFVQTNKKKLTISTKKDKESRETDNSEDKDQLEEENTELKKV
jgi:hypothetical protein